MAGKHSDFTRGMTESYGSIALLRQRWPAAFPQDDRQVRPLALTITATITTELGWSHLYTKGVFCVWKTRAAYCSAVTRYDDRIGLDGQPSGEVVTAQARIDARATLAHIAKRRARKKAAAEARNLAVVATAEAAEPVSPPTPAAPEPTPVAPSTSVIVRRRPILTLPSLRAAQ